MGVFSAGLGFPPGKYRTGQRNGRHQNRKKKRFSSRHY
jgi:hypothetical protein